MKQFRKTEDGLFICEECGKLLSKFKRSVATHIKNYHNNTKKEYYDKWLKEQNEDKCKICNNPTIFINFKSGYKHCCCINCTKQLRKKSCMEIYGVEHSLQSKEVREKSKKTCLEKYGVEIPQQALEVKEKSKQTCLEKYGVEIPQQALEVKEKSKQTCLEKYGVEYTWQAEPTKEKSKQTCLEKYGVEYSLQSIEIREKGNKTKKEKYGDENYNNNTKSKKTKKQRYGDENYTNIEKSKQTKKEKYGDENYRDYQKTKQTKKEKYGDENYNNQEKFKQTCLEKYGVEHPMQNCEIFEKSFKTRILIHQYKDTNLTYQGSYEKHFLDTYYGKIDIEKSVYIPYFFKGKWKMYRTDYFIRSLNLVVEIKNSYLTKRDKEEIEIKKNAVLAKGYNYILIINKNYDEFNKLLS